jgi:hypothetical protein
MRRSIILAAGLLAAVPYLDAAAVCRSGSVFEDLDRDSVRDAGERGLANVQVSDGRQLVRTDSRGSFAFIEEPGLPVFVIKPATHAAPRRGDGRPDLWRGEGAADCAFALQPVARAQDVLDVLVFADPQAASETDVGYYARDIVDSALDERGAPSADLGITLGDIVARGRTDLYPALDRETARLGVPWLHVAGNHDMDAAASDDTSALNAFERHYGPDTLAWETPQATFVLLDDVIRVPGQPASYIGGVRDDQFAFLERYLATAPRGRLLVLGVHIPLFDAAPGRGTFRRADRERLFRLLERFPKRLVLSGHSHTQRHVFHDAASGWRGETPLHEYNVGAASGAFWSGVKDAAGIPDATMSDGTPNGYARLRITPDGGYRLSWHPARLRDGDAAVTAAMGLHAPKVLRRGAYPAWGVYANVYMGHAGTRVEYRVDDGEWKPMTRVDVPDPRLLAENVADDSAGALRGYDRSPEATPSLHLWRGTLPMDLGVGEHGVDVRAFDPWTGEQRASTRYRLEEAAP